MQCSVEQVAKKWAHEHWEEERGDGDLFDHPHDHEHGDLNRCEQVHTQDPDVSAHAAGNAVYSFST